LGLAYLNGSLRAAGFFPRFIDVSAQVRAAEPALYGELSAVGFSPAAGGFFGPDLPLLLEVSRLREADSASLAAQILASAERSAAAIGTVDLALITLWDSNLYYSAALGAELRRRGARVVMGGPGAHLQQVRSLLVMMGVADAVLEGEGEQRVVALASMVAQGRWELVAGATVLGPNGPVHTAPPPPLAISDIAWPSFEGFGVDEWLPVLSSRGCIRDCSFCTEKSFWSRYRVRNVEDVLDEIEAHVTRWGVRRFEFNDDLLNGNPRWLKRLCDGLMERKLVSDWICFMEPYRLEPALLDLVAQAGCSLIKFGVQHFDHEMLQVMGRGSEVTSVVDTLLGTASRGIRTHFDLVPGHPGESERHHATNVRVLPEVLASHRLLRVNVNPFLLLYGSPVEQQPERYGVSIERWSPALFPHSTQSDLAQLGHQFIRSYTQTPPRELVEHRAAELDNIARAIAHGPILWASSTSSSALEVPRGAGVVLRPSPTDTPRSILDAIGRARQQGHLRVALESPGPPLHHAGFLALAVQGGLSSAVLRASGEPVHSARGAAPAWLAAASTLRQRGVPWMLHAVPEALPSDTLVDTVDAVADAKGRALLLCVHAALDAHPDPEEVLAAVACVREVLARGERRGLAVWVYGMPFCLLPEWSHRLTTRQLVADPSDAADTRHAPTHAHTCRSCADSARCPGAPPRVLALGGAQLLRPRAGRPNYDTIEAISEPAL
jgi:hypothetical protein